MKNKLLIIEADTNDADHIHKIHELNVSDEYDSELLTILPKISGVLKEHRYNWSDFDGHESPYEKYKDIFTEEEIDIFNEFRPHSSEGIHTITSIKLYDITNVTNYL